MPEISEFIVSLCENSAAKKILRFINCLFFLKKDIRVNLLGLEIYASTLDRLAALYLRKFFLAETFESALFQSILKKGMRVADIGANLGYYSLIASKLIGESGKVFAFEPEPENLRLLSKNVNINKCRNIEVIDRAVSDKTGKTALFLCEENRGDHRIYNPGDKRRKIEILTTSLDDFFKESDRLDVIKIDVQGAEPLVFAGMGRIIRKNNPLFIMMEFCPKFLGISGFSPKDFLKIIENYGFQIYFINENQKRLDLINLESINQYLNKKSVNLFLKK